MTILNAWVEQRRVLLAVDTAAHDGHGALHHVSKMMPLVHLNAVVASRGHFAFLSIMGGQCRLAAADFDGLIAAMPAALEDVVKMFRAAVATKPMPGAGGFDEQYVVAAGWSASAGRMLAWEFRRGEDGAGFTASRIERPYIAPWCKRFEYQHPAPSSAPAMAALARDQIKLYEERAPSLRAGGRLIAAHLDRWGMRIEPVCDL